MPSWWGSVKSYVSGVVSNVIHAPVKRMVRHALRKALGEFITTPITDEMVDLALLSGGLTLKDVLINVSAINKRMGTSPIVLTMVHISSLSLSIPLQTLMTDGIKVSIMGVRVRARMLSGDDMSFATYCKDIASAVSDYLLRGLQESAMGASDDNCDEDVEGDNEDAVGSHESLGQGITGAGTGASLAVGASEPTSGLALLLGSDQGLRVVAEALESALGRAVVEVLDISVRLEWPLFWEKSNLGKNGIVESDISSASGASSFRSMYRSRQARYGNGKSVRVGGLGGVARDAGAGTGWSAGAVGVASAEAPVGETERGKMREEWRERGGPGAVREQGSDGACGQEVFVGEMEKESEEQVTVQFLTSLGELGETHSASLGSRSSEDVFIETPMYGYTSRIGVLVFHLAELSARIFPPDLEQMPENPPISGFSDNTGMSSSPSLANNLVGPGLAYDIRLTMRGWSAWCGMDAQFSDVVSRTALIRIPEKMNEERKSGKSSHRKSTKKPVCPYGGTYFSSSSGNIMPGISGLGSVRTKVFPEQDIPEMCEDLDSLPILNSGVLYSASCVVATCAGCGWAGAEGDVGAWWHRVAQSDQDPLHSDKSTLHGDPTLLSWPQLEKMCTHNPSPSTSPSLPACAPPPLWLCMHCAASAANRISSWRAARTHASASGAETATVHAATQVQAIGAAVTAAGVAVGTSGGSERIRHARSRSHSTRRYSAGNTTAAATTTTTTTTTTTSSSSGSAAFDARADPSAVVRDGIGAGAPRRSVVFPGLPSSISTHIYSNAHAGTQGHSRQGGVDAGDDGAGAKGSGTGRAGLDKARLSAYRLPCYTTMQQWYEAYSEQYLSLLSTNPSKLSSSLSPCTCQQQVQLGLPRCRYHGCRVGACGLPLVLTSGANTTAQHPSPHDPHGSAGSPRPRPSTRTAGSSPAASAAPATSPPGSARVLNEDASRHGQCGEAADDVGAGLGKSEDTSIGMGNDTAVLVCRIQLTHPNREKRYSGNQTASFSQIRIPDDSIDLPEPTEPQVPLYMRGIAYEDAPTSPSSSSSSAFAHVSSSHVPASRSSSTNTVFDSASTSQYIESPLSSEPSLHNGILGLDADVSLYAQLASLSDSVCTAMYRERVTHVDDSDDEATSHAYSSNSNPVSTTTLSTSSSIAASTHTSSSASTSTSASVSASHATDPAELAVPPIFSLSLRLPALAIFLRPAHISTLLALSSALTNAESCGNQENSLPENPDQELPVISPLSEPVHTEITITHPTSSPSRHYTVTLHQRDTVHLSLSAAALVVAVATEDAPSAAQVWWGARTLREQSVRRLCQQQLCKESSSVCSGADRHLGARAGGAGGVGRADAAEERRREDAAMGVDAGACDCPSCLAVELLVEQHVYAAEGNYSEICDTTSRNNDNGGNVVSIDAFSLDGPSPSPNVKSTQSSSSVTPTTLTWLDAYALLRAKKEANASPAAANMADAATSTNTSTTSPAADVAAREEASASILSQLCTATHVPQAVSLPHTTIVDTDVKAVDSVQPVDNSLTLLKLLHLHSAPSPLSCLDQWPQDLQRAAALPLPPTLLPHLCSTRVLSSLPSHLLLQVDDIHFEMNVAQHGQLLHVDVRKINVREGLREHTMVIPYTREDHGVVLGPTPAPSSSSAASAPLHARSRLHGSQLKSTLFPPPENILSQYTFSRNPDVSGFRLPSYITYYPLCSVSSSATMALSMHMYTHNTHNTATHTHTSAGTPTATSTSSASSPSPCASSAVLPASRAASLSPSPLHAHITTHNTHVLLPPARPSSHPLSALLHDMRSTLPSPSLLHRLAMLAQAHARYTKRAELVHQKYIAGTKFSSPAFGNKNMVQYHHIPPPPKALLRSASSLLFQKFLHLSQPGKTNTSEQTLSGVIPSPALYLSVVLLLLRSHSLRQAILSCAHTPTPRLPAPSPSPSPLPRASSASACATIAGATGTGRTAALAPTHDSARAYPSASSHLSSFVSSHTHALPPPLALMHPYSRVPLAVAKIPVPTSPMQTQSHAAPDFEQPLLSRVIVAVAPIQMYFDGNFPLRISPIISAISEFEETIVVQQALQRVFVDMHCDITDTICNHASETELFSQHYSVLSYERKQASIGSSSPAPHPWPPNTDLSTTSDTSATHTHVASSPLPPPHTQATTGKSSSPATAPAAPAPPPAPPLPPLALAPAPALAQTLLCLSSALVHCLLPDPVLAPHQHVQTQLHSPRCPHYARACSHALPASGPAAASYPLLPCPCPVATILRTDARGPVSCEHLEFSVANVGIDIGLIPNYISYLAQDVQYLQNATVSLDNTQNSGKSEVPDILENSAKQVSLPLPVLAANIIREARQAQLALLSDSTIGKNHSGIDMENTSPIHSLWRNSEFSSEISEVSRARRPTAGTSKASESRQGSGSGRRDGAAVFGGASISSLLHDDYYADNVPRNHHNDSDNHHDSVKHVEETLYAYIPSFIPVPENEKSGKSQKPQSRLDVSDDVYDPSSSLALYLAMQPSRAHSPSSSSPSPSSSLPPALALLPSLLAPLYLSCQPAQTVHISVQTCRLSMVYQENKSGVIIPRNNDFHSGNNGYDHEIGDLSKITDNITQLCDSVSKIGDSNFEKDICPGPPPLSHLPRSPAALPISLVKKDILLVLPASLLPFSDPHMAATLHTNANNVTASDTASGPLSASSLASSLESATLRHGVSVGVRTGAAEASQTDAAAAEEFSVAMIDAVLAEEASTAQRRAIQRDDAAHKSGSAEDGDDGEGVDVYLVPLPPSLIRRYTHKHAHARARIQPDSTHTPTHTSDPALLHSSVTLTFPCTDTHTLPPALQQQLCRLHALRADAAAALDALSRALLHAQNMQVHSPPASPAPPASQSSVSVSSEDSPTPTGLSSRALAAWRAVLPALATIPCVTTPPQVHAQPPRTPTATTPASAPPPFSLWASMTEDATPAHHPLALLLRSLVHPSFAAQLAAEPHAAANTASASATTATTAGTGAGAGAGLSASRPSGGAGAGTSAAAGAGVGASASVHPKTGYLADVGPASRHEVDLVLHPVPMLPSSSHREDSPYSNSSLPARAPPPRPNDASRAQEKASHRPPSRAPLPPTVISYADEQDTHTSSSSTSTVAAAPLAPYWEQLQLMRAQLLVRVALQTIRVDLGSHEIPLLTTFATSLSEAAEVGLTAHTVTQAMGVHILQAADRDIEESGKNRAFLKNAFSVSYPTVSGRVVSGWRGMSFAPSLSVLSQTLQRPMHAAQQDAQRLVKTAQRPVADAASVDAEQSSTLAAQRSLAAGAPMTAATARADTSPLRARDMRERCRTCPIHGDASANATATCDALNSSHDAGVTTNSRARATTPASVSSNAALSPPAPAPLPTLHGVLHKTKDASERLGGTTQARQVAGDGAHDAGSEPTGQVRKAGSRKTSPNNSRKISIPEFPLSIFSEAEHPLTLALSSHPPWKLLSPQTLVQPLPVPLLLAYLATFPALRMTAGRALVSMGHTCAATMVIPGKGYRTDSMGVRGAASQVQDTGVREDTGAGRGAGAGVDVTCPTPPIHTHAALRVLSHLLASQSLTAAQSPITTPERLTNLSQSPSPLSQSPNLLSPSVPLSLWFALTPATASSPLLPLVPVMRVADALFDSLVEREEDLLICTISSSSSSASSAASALSSPSAASMSLSSQALIDCLAHPLAQASDGTAPPLPARAAMLSTLSPPTTCSATTSTSPSASVSASPCELLLSLSLAPALSLPHPSLWWAVLAANTHAYVPRACTRATQLHSVTVQRPDATESATQRLGSRNSLDPALPLSQYPSVILSLSPIPPTDCEEVPIFDNTQSAKHGIPDAIPIHFSRAISWIFQTHISQEMSNMGKAHNPGLNSGVSSGYYTHPWLTTADGALQQVFVYLPMKDVRVQTTTMNTSSKLATATYDVNFYKYCYAMVSALALLEPVWVSALSAGGVGDGGHGDRHVSDVHMRDAVATPSSSTSVSAFASAYNGAFSRTIAALVPGQSHTYTHASPRASAQTQIQMQTPAHTVDTVNAVATEKTGTMNPEGETLEFVNEKKSSSAGVPPADLEQTLFTSALEQTMLAPAATPLSLATHSTPPSPSSSPLPRRRDSPAPALSPCQLRPRTPPLSLPVRIRATIHLYSLLRRLRDSPAAARAALRADVRAAVAVARRLLASDGCGVVSACRGVAMPVGSAAVSTSDGFEASAGPVTASVLQDSVLTTYTTTDVRDYVDGGGVGVASNATGNTGGVLHDSDLSLSLSLSLSQALSLSRMDGSALADTALPLTAAVHPAVFRTASSATALAESALTQSLSQTALFTTGLFDTALLADADADDATAGVGVPLSGMGSPGAGTDMDTDAFSHDSASAANIWGTSTLLRSCYESSLYIDNSVYDAAALCREEEDVAERLPECGAGAGQAVAGEEGERHGGDNGDACAVTDGGTSVSASHSASRRGRAASSVPNTLSHSPSNTPSDAASGTLSTLSAELDVSVDVSGLHDSRVRRAAVAVQRALREQEKRQLYEDGDQKPDLDNVFSGKDEKFGILKCTCYSDDSTPSSPVLSPAADASAPQHMEKQLDEEDTVMDNSKFPMFVAPCPDRFSVSLPLPLALASLPPLISAARDRDRARAPVAADADVSPSPSASVATPARAPVLPALSLALLRPAPSLPAAAASLPLPLPYAVLLTVHAGILTLHPTHAHAPFLPSPPPAAAAASRAPAGDHACHHADQNAAEHADEHGAEHAIESLVRDIVHRVTAAPRTHTLSHSPPAAAASSASSSDLSSEEALLLGEAVGLFGRDAVAFWTLVDEALAGVGAATDAEAACVETVGEGTSASVGDVASISVRQRVLRALRLMALSSPRLHAAQPAPAPAPPAPSSSSSPSTSSSSLPLLPLAPPAHRSYLADISGLRVCVLPCVPEVSVATELVHDALRAFGTLSEAAETAELSSSLSSSLPSLSTSVVRTVQMLLSQPAIDLSAPLSQHLASPTSTDTPNMEIPDSDPNTTLLTSLVSSPALRSPLLPASLLLAHLSSHLHALTHAPLRVAVSASDLAFAQYTHNLYAGGVFAPEQSACVRAAMQGHTVAVHAHPRARGDIAPIGNGTGTGSSVTGGSVVGAAVGAVEGLYVGQLVASSALFEVGDNTRQYIYNAFLAHDDNCDQSTVYVDISDNAHPLVARVRPTTRTIAQFAVRHVLMPSSSVLALLPSLPVCGATQVPDQPQPQPTSSSGSISPASLAATSSSSSLPPSSMTSVSSGLDRDVLCLSSATLQPLTCARTPHAPTVAAPSSTSTAAPSSSLLMASPPPPPPRRCVAPRSWAPPVLTITITMGERAAPIAVHVPTTTSTAAAPVGAGVTVSDGAAAPRASLISSAHGTLHPSALPLAATDVDVAIRRLTLLLDPMQLWPMDVVALAMPADPRMSQADVVGVGLGLCCQWLEAVGDAVSHAVAQSLPCLSSSTTSVANIVATRVCPNTTTTSSTASTACATAPDAEAARISQNVPLLPTLPLVSLGVPAITTPMSVALSAINANTSGIAPTPKSRPRMSIAGYMSGRLAPMASPAIAGITTPIAGITTEKHGSHFRRGSVSHGAGGSDATSMTATAPSAAHAAPPHPRSSTLGHAHLRQHSASAADVRGVSASDVCSGAETSHVSSASLASSTATSSKLSSVLTRYRQDAFHPFQAFPSWFLQPKHVNVHVSAQSCLLDYSPNTTQLEDNAPRNSDNNGKAEEDDDRPQSSLHSSKSLSKSSKLSSYARTAARLLLALPSLSLSVAIYAPAITEINVAVTGAIHLLDKALKPCHMPSRVLRVHATAAKRVAPSALGEAHTSTHGKAAASIAGGAAREGLVQGYAEQSGVVESCDGVSGASGDDSAGSRIDDEEDEVSSGDCEAAVDPLREDSRRCMRNTSTYSQLSTQSSSLSSQLAPVSWLIPVIHAYWGLPDYSVAYGYLRPGHVPAPIIAHTYTLDRDAPAPSSASSSSTSSAAAGDGNPTLTNNHTAAALASLPSATSHTPLPTASTSAWSAAPPPHHSTSSCALVSRHWLALYKQRQRRTGLHGLRDSAAAHFARDTATSATDIHTANAATASTSTTATAAASTGPATAAMTGPSTAETIKAQHSELYAMYRNIPSSWLQSSGICPSPFASPFLMRIPENYHQFKKSVTSSLFPHPLPSRSVTTTSSLPLSVHQYLLDRGYVSLLKLDGLTCTVTMERRGVEAGLWHNRHSHTSVVQWGEVSAALLRDAEAAALDGVAAVDMAEGLSGGAAGADIALDHRHGCQRAGSPGSSRLSTPDLELAPTFASSPSLALSPADRIAAARALFAYSLPVCYLSPFSVMAVPPLSVDTQTQLRRLHHQWVLENIDKKREFTVSLDTHTKRVSPFFGTGASILQHMRAYTLDRWSVYLWPRADTPVEHTRLHGDTRIRAITTTEADPHAQTHIHAQIRPSTSNIAPVPATSAAAHRADGSATAGTGVSAGTSTGTGISALSCPSLAAYLHVHPLVLSLMHRLVDTDTLDTLPRRAAPPSAVTLPPGGGSYPAIPVSLALACGYAHPPLPPHLLSILLSPSLAAPTPLTRTHSLPLSSFSPTRDSLSASLLCSLATSSPLTSVALSVSGLSSSLCMDSVLALTSFVTAVTATLEKDKEKEVLMAVGSTAEADAARTEFDEHGTAPFAHGGRGYVCTDDKVYLRGGIEDGEDSNDAAAEGWGAEVINQMRGGVSVSACADVWVEGGSGARRPWEDGEDGMGTLGYSPRPRDLFDPFGVPMIDPENIDSSEHLDSGFSQQLGNYSQASAHVALAPSVSGTHPPGSHSRVSSRRRSSSSGFTPLPLPMPMPPMPLSHAPMASHLPRGFGTPLSQALSLADHTRRQVQAPAPGAMSLPAAAALVGHELHTGPRASIIEDYVPARTRTGSGTGMAVTVMGVGTGVSTGMQDPDMHMSSNSNAWDSGNATYRKDNFPFSQFSESSEDDWEEIGNVSLGNQGSSVFDSDDDPDFEEIAHSETRTAAFPTGKNTIPGAGKFGFSEHGSLSSSRLRASKTPFLRSFKRDDKHDHMSNSHAKAEVQIASTHGLPLHRQAHEWGLGVDMTPKMAYNAASSAAPGPSLPPHRRGSIAQGVPPHALHSYAHPSQGMCGPNQTQTHFAQSAAAPSPVPTSPSNNLPFTPIETYFPEPQEEVSLALPAHQLRPQLQPRGVHHGPITHPPLTMLLSVVIKDATVTLHAGVDHARNLPFSQKDVFSGPTSTTSSSSSSSPDWTKVLALPYADLPPSFLPGAAVAASTFSAGASDTADVDKGDKADRTDTDAGGVTPSSTSSSLASLLSSPQAMAECMGSPLGPHTALLMLWLLPPDSLRRAAICTLSLDTIMLTTHTFTFTPPHTPAVVPALGHPPPAATATTDVDADLTLSLTSTSPAPVFAPVPASEHLSSSLSIFATGLTVLDKVASSPFAELLASLPLHPSLDLPRIRAVSLHMAHRATGSLLETDVALALPPWKVNVHQNMERNLLCMAAIAAVYSDRLATDEDVHPVYSHPLGTSLAATHTPNSDKHSAATALPSTAVDADVAALSDDAAAGSVPSETYLANVTIRPLAVCIDYEAAGANFNNLLAGNVSELLHVLSFRGLLLQLPSANIRNAGSWGALMPRLLASYQERLHVMGTAGQVVQAAGAMSGVSELVRGVSWLPFHPQKAASLIATGSLRLLHGSLHLVGGVLEAGTASLRGTGREEESARESVVEESSAWVHLSDLIVDEIALGSPRGRSQRSDAQRGSDNSAADAGDEDSQCIVVKVGDKTHIVRLPAFTSMLQSSDAREVAANGARLDGMRSYATADAEAVVDNRKDLRHIENNDNHIASLSGKHGHFGNNCGSSGNRVPDTRHSRHSTRMALSYIREGVARAVEAAFTIPLKQIQAQGTAQGVLAAARGVPALILEPASGTVKAAGVLVGELLRHVDASVLKPKYKG